MKVVKKGIGYRVKCSKCSSILEVKRKEIWTEEPWGEITLCKNVTPAYGTNA